MNTASVSLGASVSSQSRFMQLALAALLGTFIIGLSASRISKRSTMPVMTTGIRWRFPATDEDLTS